MRRIEIDPNVRVRGNLTFSGVEDADGPVAVGDEVEVVESESGMWGRGTVAEVDDERLLVFIDVDWSSLRGGRR